MLKVRAGPIAATTSELSTPPDRKAPRGTSLISWRWTDSRTFASTASSHSPGVRGSVPLWLLLTAGSRHQVCRSIRLVERSTSSISAGCSLRTSWSSVAGAGTYSQARNWPSASRSSVRPQTPDARTAFTSEPKTRCCGVTA